MKLTWVAIKLHSTHVDFFAEENVKKIMHSSHQMGFAAFYVLGKEELIDSRFYNFLLFLRADFYDFQ